MPSTADTHTEVAQAQPFTFQPPAGGDIILKSSDGASFSAHSVILGMASTVFADMFAGAMKSDSVELAEDAESISLMLAFIYPVTALPQITTIDHLEKFMVIAQKYDIQRIINFIEEILKMGNELVSLDPMRIFYLSVTHNFPTIQALSAECLRPKNCDLLTVEGLLQLAKYFPHAAPAIGLAGAQGARVAILNRVIRAPHNYGCYQLSVLGDDSNLGATLPACSSHLSPESRPRSGLGDYSRSNIGTTRVPDYCNLWLGQLYDQLLEKPMHECDSYFSVSSLANLGDKKCNNCIVKALGERAVFEQWALNVKTIVQKQLKVLDVLYSL